MLKTVKLTYFRYGGKYYGEHTFNDWPGNASDAIEQTRVCLEERRLEGLCGNHGPYFVVVSFPDDGLPERLIMDEKVRMLLLAIEEGRTVPRHRQMDLEESDERPDMTGTLANDEAAHNRDLDEEVELQRRDDRAWSDYDATLEARRRLKDKDLPF